MMSQQIGDYCISHQAVLDLIKNKYGMFSHPEVISKFINLEEEIKKLPPKDRSVQDFVDKCRECGKQKTGHWITTRTFMHDGEYYCDKCKCDAPNNEKWDYCPNCGAKMENKE